MYQGVFVPTTPSGLDHGFVQRLKPSWEKVPGKYKKLMEVGAEDSVTHLC